MNLRIQKVKLIGLCLDWQDWWFRGEGMEDGIIKSNFLLFVLVIPRYAETLKDGQIWGNRSKIMSFVWASWVWGNFEMYKRYQLVVCSNPVLRRKLWEEDLYLGILLVTEVLVVMDFIAQGDKRRRKEVSTQICGTPPVNDW